MITYTATYSPEDNKLRLYASQRLDAETYTRVKAAGFSWAPKQELFVAPMWTPARAQLLEELAGDIGDENTTLADRADARAERFAVYSDKRAHDAETARAGVARIADGIPLGQPILVGHHSERHARKDAERIENGMRRAVKMWETSKYWTDRAAGALAHTKYAERPDVRARRIKKIEADARKVRKSLAEVETLLKYWRNPLVLLKEECRNEPDALEKAVTHLAGRDHWAVYERDATGGYVRCYDALRNGVPAADVQARAIANKEIALRPDCAARQWLAHYENRLAYERAMLGETGYVEPPKAPTRTVLPILNYAGTVEYRRAYGKPGEHITCEAVGITSAEYAKLWKDYKGTLISADGTHRVRSMVRNHSLTVVYFTDKKQHPKPGAAENTAAQAKVDQRVRDGQQRLAEQSAKRREVVQRNRAIINGTTDTTTTATPAPIVGTMDRATADAMRATLKAGITVAVVPDLFPTPNALAARMIDAADIEPGHRVLEPSAGTGSILGAMGGRMFGHNPERGEIVAVEINAALCARLRTEFPLTDVRAVDFLACNGDLGTFDRIVMNPPFSKAADLAHIAHAREYLRPGGRLVALCANGPRQQAAFANDDEATYEALPAGSFAEQGTNVSVAMVVIDKHAERDTEPLDRGPCEECRGRGGNAGGPCEACHGSGEHWTRDELADFEPSEAQLTELNEPQ